MFEKYGVHRGTGTDNSLPCLADWKYVCRAAELAGSSRFWLRVGFPACRADVQSPRRHVSGFDRTVDLSGITDKHLCLRPRCDSSRGGNAASTRSPPVVCHAPLDLQDMEELTAFVLS